METSGRSPLRPTDDAASRIHSNSNINNSNNNNEKRHLCQADGGQGLSSLPTGGAASAQRDPTASTRRHILSNGRHCQRLILPQPGFSSSSASYRESGTRNTGKPLRGGPRADCPGHTLHTCTAQRGQEQNQQRASRRGARSWSRSSHSRSHYEGTASNSNSSSSSVSKRKSCGLADGRGNRRCDHRTGRRLQYFAHQRHG